MSIVLLVETKTPPLSWPDFKRRAAPFSIGIDGYVAAPPKYDPRGPWLNLNHHEGVSRLETRASCEQALMAIRMGLFERFRDKHNEPLAYVLTNDCDQDVCATWTCLHRYDLSGQVINPALNRLIFMEDMLDTTAGAYPFPVGLQSLQELAWIFDPYHKFRVSGAIDRRIAEEFKAVIEEVEERIVAATKGKGKTTALETNYRIIDKGTEWCMVEEIGTHARLGIFNDHVHAFASVRMRPDGKYVYSLTRRSVFIPIPLDKIVRAANKIEYAKGGIKDLWGGSELVIGSPRVAGSAIPLDEFFHLVEREIKHYRKTLNV